MTEYVTAFDLYVLADSQEEAEAITARIIEEVFTREDVLALEADRPEAL